MLPREAAEPSRGGNQQSGPTTSDMPEPFKDPSGDGMEWLCKPAASEDNVCGWFTVCQPKHLGVLTSLTDRAARMRIRKIGPSRLNAQRFELAHPLRATRAVNLVKTSLFPDETTRTNRASHVLVSGFPLGIPTSVMDITTLVVVPYAIMFMRHLHFGHASCAY